MNYERSGYPWLCTENDAISTAKSARVYRACQNSHLYGALRQFFLREVAFCLLIRLTALECFFLAIYTAAVKILPVSFRWKLMYQFPSFFADRCSLFPPDKWIPFPPLEDPLHFPQISYWAMPSMQRKKRKCFQSQTAVYNKRYYRLNAERLKSAATML